MNNLFRREKENWWLWILWGITGAVALFYTAKITHSFAYPIAALAALLIFLTWWMSYSKRFSFWRALRGLLIVFNIACAPLLFFNFESMPLLSGADLGARIIMLLGLGIVAATVCSFIAKQPRQYY